MYRIAVGTVVSLLILGAVHGQTISEVEALIDAQNYSEAKSKAQTLFENAGEAEKPKAAELFLRSANMAGDHPLLEQRFDECVVAASGTDSEAFCYLERAKSVETNVKDSVLARRLYTEIVQAYPTHAVVAPESLYQRAGLELTALEPETAKSSYDAVITRYANSSFVDASYAGLAKAEAALMNPEGIRDAVQILENQFPASPYLLHAILAQADFANQKSGNQREAMSAYNRLIQLKPDSQGAVIARLRLADMATDGKFEQYIADYKMLLRDHVNLSKSLVDWANCQIGIYYWQLDKQDDAKVFFELVVNAEPPASQNVLSSAQLHLSAFANPASMEMIQVLFDRGLRWRSSGRYRDRCWKDWSQVQKLTKEPFYDSYFANSENSGEERAKMHYHMALVAFEMGDHNAVEELAQKALDLQPEGITRQQALFIQGYHHGHCGHHKHAIMIYRQILEERPDHKELVPSVYLEMAKAYERDGDALGVLLTAEEFRILHPYRVECQQLEGTQKRLKLARKSLREEFASAQKELAARLEKKLPPVSLTLSYKQPKISGVGPLTLAEEGAK